MAIKGFLYASFIFFLPCINLASLQKLLDDTAKSLLNLSFCVM